MLGLPLGHTDDITSLQFSIDGTKLLSASSDGSLKIWDIQSGKLLKDSGVLTELKFFSVINASPNLNYVLYSAEGINEGEGEVFYDFQKGTISRDIPVNTFSSDEKWGMDMWGKLVDLTDWHNLPETPSFEPDGFTPNGKHFYKITNTRLYLWNAHNLQLEKTIELFDNTEAERYGSVEEAKFKAYGKILQDIKTDSALDDEELYVVSTFQYKFWDLETRSPLFTIPAITDHQIIDITTNGKYLLLENDGIVKLFDPIATDTIQVYGSSDDRWLQPTLSPDGQFIARGSEDGTIYLHELMTGNLRQSFRTYIGPIDRLQYGSESNLLYVQSRSGATYSWNLELGIIKDSVFLQDDEEEKLAATVDSLNEHHPLPDFDWIGISPDRSVVLSGSIIAPTLWTYPELDTLKQLKHGWKTFGHTRKAIFSPDGTKLAVLQSPDGGEGRSFDLRDITSDKVTRYPLWNVHLAAFTPDSRFLVVNSGENELYWYNTTDQLLHDTLPNHQGRVNTLSFFPNKKWFASGAEDGQIKLWDVNTRTEIATLMKVGRSDWIVLGPDGLFDASPGAMELMYYVVPYGKDEYEVIELEQLKTRYYEPGLLQKVLGFTNERLRPVENFDSVALYPKVKLARIDSTGTLHIQLSERNGGIGKVSIFINGKEVKEEANPLPRRENAKRDSIIQYDLKQHHKYFSRDNDIRNTVSIRAYNEEGWLKSSAVNLEYLIPAARSKGRGSSGGNASGLRGINPKLYVISVGTSDYSGTQLDLKYGDQDATMMAKALQAVGIAMVGEADSLEVHCLTTAQADNTGLEGTPIIWHPADKAGIQLAFEQVKDRAKAEDVVVVYFSGHGVTQGGTDQTLFYYLTRDVASEDALSDPGTRRKYAISSEEMTDWLKAIPALKQVLIIDACNSGQVVEHLVGGSKALNSSQTRALDRLRDRTGMFVLSGSAADKVSFEAGVFGQGLLTYALLEGMRSGNRSDTDGKRMAKMIDVMTLFQYARDRVPELATSINGTQIPMLGFPSRASSFDIGILDEQATAAIQLSKEKPIVIRSIFLNEATYRDDLKLADQLEAIFRKETKKGATAELVYVDVYDYPGAYSLGGFYRETAAGIELKLKLLHGDDPPVTLDIPVTRDTDRLVRSMVQAVRRAILL